MELLRRQMVRRRVNVLIADIIATVDDLNTLYDPARLRK
jgi:hypothetical protein